MKRVVTSVFAFIFILSLGTVRAVYFDKTCTEIQQAINESIRLAEGGNYPAAATVAQNAEDLWDSKKYLLSYVVNRGYIYEVDARLTGLSQLSSEEAKEEFLSCAEQVIQALDYVSHDK